MARFEVSLMHLDSRKRSPTWKIARAVANECRSSEDGDIVDKVVIVGIKSFAELESVCKPRLRISTSTVELTSLRLQRSKEPIHHAADSVIARSPALFVQLSTTTNSGVAYSSMRHDSLPDYGTTAPSRPAQQSPQKLHFSIAYLAFQTHFQPELQLHSTDRTCPVTLNLPNFRSFFLAIPPRIFESGGDDTEPVQMV